MPPKPDLTQLIDDACRYLDREQVIYNREYVARRLPVMLAGDPNDNYIGMHLAAFLRSRGLID